MCPHLKEGLPDLLLCVATIQDVRIKLYIEIRVCNRSLKWWRIPLSNSTLELQFIEMMKDVRIKLYIEIRICNNSLKWWRMSVSSWAKSQIKSLKTCWILRAIEDVWWGCRSVVVIPSSACWHICYRSHCYHCFQYHIDFMIGIMTNGPESWMVETPWPWPRSYSPSWLSPQSQRWHFGRCLPSSERFPSAFINE